MLDFLVYLLYLRRLAFPRGYTVRISIRSRSVLGPWSRWLVFLRKNTRRASQRATWRLFLRIRKSPSELLDSCTAFRRLAAIYFAVSARGSMPPEILERGRVRKYPRQWRVDSRGVFPDGSGLITLGT